MQDAQPVGKQAATLSAGIILFCIILSCSDAICRYHLVRLQVLGWLCMNPVFVMFVVCAHSYAAFVRCWGLRHLCWAVSIVHLGKETTRGNVVHDKELLNTPMPVRCGIQWIMSLSEVAVLQ